MRTRSTRPAGTRRVAVVAGLAALLAVAAPASASTLRVNSGPLGDAAGGGTQSYCAPAGARSTMGLLLLRNSSSRPVVMDTVALSDSVGLSVAEAYLVPIRGGTTLVGVDTEWPPPTRNLTAPGVQWQERQRAAGGTVAGGATDNLVLVLVATSETGTSRAVEVGYHDAAGSQHLWRTKLAVQVRTRDPRCSALGLT